MEAEKRECLCETSQHQFRIISITNQPTKTLADNHPSYLHRYTCDVAVISVPANTTSSKCDPGCLPQALRNSCYVWLPSCPPFTKTAHFYNVNLELFTVVEAQTETAGHLSSQPSGTHSRRIPPRSRGCPNKKASPKCSGNPAKHLIRQVAAL